MANFEALVKATIDLSDAESKLNSFINQSRKIDIPVNLQFNQANQALNSLLQQFQSQGGNAGSQFSSQFVNQINNGIQSISATGLVNQFGKQTNKLTLNIRNSMRNVSQQQNRFNENTARTFDNQMTAWARSNSKAVKSMMKDNTRTYGEAINDLHSRMNTAILNQDADAVKQVKEEFKLLQSEARATGNVGKSFADSFKSSFGSVAKLAASYVTIQKVFNEMKQGVQTVVELDTALVDLQKTSTATPKQLNSFYKDANDIAKEYGTTTQQIIQGAADWSRLGYNLTDAKTMSKLSSQFAAISPGMSVEESTSGLVSTMKAFGIEADDVLENIMSKVNKVGFKLPKRIVIYGNRNVSADSYIG